MIRPRYSLDSIIARKVSAPEFLHNLDPYATLSTGEGGVVVEGGRAPERGVEALEYAPHSPTSSAHHAPLEPRPALS